MTLGFQSENAQFCQIFKHVKDTGSVYTQIARQLILVLAGVETLMFI